MGQKIINKQDGRTLRQGRCPSSIFLLGQYQCVSVGLLWADLVRLWKYTLQSILVVAVFVEIVVAYFIAKVNISGCFQRYT